MLWQGRVGLEPSGPAARSLLACSALWVFLLNVAGDIPRLLRCLSAPKRGTAAVMRDAQGILYGSAVVMLRVGGREADLLLSQMHLSHSGLGSCDSTAITREMSWLYYMELCVLFHHPLETKITTTHLGLPGIWDRSPTQQAISPSLGTTAARSCSAFLVVAFLQDSRHMNSTNIRFFGQFVMWV